MKNKRFKLKREFHYNKFIFNILNIFIFNLKDIRKNLNYLSIKKYIYNNCYIKIKDGYYISKKEKFIKKFATLNNNEQYFDWISRNKEIKTISNPIKKSRENLQFNRIIKTNKIINYNNNEINTNFCKKQYLGTNNRWKNKIIQISTKQKSRIFEGIN